VLASQEDPFSERLCSPATGVPTLNVFSCTRTLRNTLCNVDETSSKTPCNSDVSDLRIPSVTRQPLPCLATVSSVGKNPSLPGCNSRLGVHKSESKNRGPATQGASLSLGRPERSGSECSTTCAELKSKGRRNPKEAICNLNFLTINGPPNICGQELPQANC
jgi:hypothetical protein